MPDRYEIVKDKHRVPNTWGLFRVDDDPEFGFSHYVGGFRTKGIAEKQLAKIVEHPDMNFAEWFYSRRDFTAHAMVDEERMHDFFYRYWRTVSGYLIVNECRTLMTSILQGMRYVADMHQNEIDDLRMEMAMNAAGEDW